MSLIRKIYPVAIAVALLAGAAYLVKSQFATTSSVPQQAEQNDESTSEESKTPVVDTSTTSPDPDTTETAAIEPADNIEKESPFAVVESTDDGDAEGAVDSTEPQTDITETSVVNDDNSNAEAISTSRSSTTSIVVPDSYPIEDAGKYFIPKDQRGPGNLGGPPPLNFPGGPNDPNLTLPTE